MMIETTQIYVIGGNAGLKKIGLARQPARRLRILQTGHGAPISVLYSRPVPRDISANVEARAHWLLREFRAHGEWFTTGLKAAKEAVDQAADERGEGEKARFAVGRPPLNVKQTIVRLSEDARQRIEALVGPNRMAEFIREAVERELKRREKAAKDES